MTDNVQLMARGIDIDISEAMAKLVSLIPADKMPEADKAIRTLTHAMDGYGQMRSAMRTLRSQAEHAARADDGAVNAIKSILLEK